ncbi:unnamed protein product [Calypogeia fissa]
MTESKHCYKNFSKKFAKAFTDAVLSNNPDIQDQLAQFSAYEKSGRSYLNRRIQASKDGNLQRKVFKAISDLYATKAGETVDVHKVSRNNVGTVADLTRSADEFIRELATGGKDGYFVSSKCLLGLEVKQQQSLRSILWEAGYSEIHQTTTTILFARIKNGEDNPISESSQLKENLVSRQDIHEVGASKGDDKQPLPRRGWVKEKIFTNIINGIRQLARRSSERDISLPSPKDCFDKPLSQVDSMTEMLEPPRRNDISLVEEEVATWRSFKAALESKSHPSICVSTPWLSDLKLHEKEALPGICLEAGYKKIHETSTKTWFERIRVRRQNPGGSGQGDASSSSASKGDIAAAGVTESGSSACGDSLKSRKDNGRSPVLHDFTTNGPVPLAATERRRAEEERFTCRPQLLRVACLSMAPTSRVLSSAKDEIVEQHDHEHLFPEVVTMPNLGERYVKLISTSVARRFSIPSIDFSSEGKAEKAIVTMNAQVTNSLSCCLRIINHNPPEVRMKFSEISGEVKGVDLDEQPCNFIVLSCIGTTVYGCIRRADNEDDFEQIALDLDDEYRRPRGRAVEQVRRDHANPSDIDLVWLEISSSHAKNRKAGSITLGLRADVNARLDDDLRTKVQRAHTLSFYNAQRPVIFEGKIEVDDQQQSFLEFQIRYKLEVCYYKPSITTGEEFLFCPCTPTPQTIDFICCFRIRSENF